jgi:hypothetical protein
MGCRVEGCNPFPFGREKTASGIWSANLVLLLFSRSNEVICGLWNGRSIHSRNRNWARVGPLTGIGQPLREAMIYLEWQSDFL